MEEIYVPGDYLPVMIQTALAGGFVIAVMALTHFMGVKRRKIRTQKKDENFECGIEIKGNARFPFSVKYFLIAILFVLFDVEIIFFYPWAVNFHEIARDGLIAMLIFSGGLLFGYWYIIRKGSLDWNENE